MLRPLDLLACAFIAAGFYVLVRTWRFLRRNRKAAPVKHVTIVDPLSPLPLVERWCGACNKRVADNHNEHWLACPRCGGPLSHMSLVVAAEAPDEPATWPDGKGAA